MDDDTRRTKASAPDTPGGPSAEEADSIGDAATGDAGVVGAARRPPVDPDADDAAEPPAEFSTDAYGDPDPDPAASGDTTREPTLALRETGRASDPRPPPWGSEHDLARSGFLAITVLGTLTYAIAWFGLTYITHQVETSPGSRTDMQAWLEIVQNLLQLAPALVVGGLVLGLYGLVLHPRRTGAADPYALRVPLIIGAIAATALGLGNRLQPYLMQSTQHRAAGPLLIALLWTALTVVVAWLADGLGKAADLGRPAAAPHADGSDDGPTGGDDWDGDDTPSSADEDEDVDYDATRRRH